MEENKGIQLLKKGQKGIIHALFSRFGIFLVLLLVQVFILFGIFQWFEGILPYLLGGHSLFSAVMVIYLINSRIDATAKITWLIVIMLFPVFGALLFWYTKSEIGHRAIQKRLNEIYSQTKGSILQNEKVMDELTMANPQIASLSRYIGCTGNFPVYKNTEVTYFPLGEYKWEEMQRQLKKAKKFIFMEYFIIDEGLMWGKILEILIQKAKEGVDVRVMYDGTCEFALLPHNYPKRLRELGIQCKMFSPVTPFMSTHYNYRDHRKILVIDGQTAFNGGVNLADEYINHIHIFGHWKDTAVMIKGEAVKSFTLMFLQMWNIDKKELQFEQYLNVQADCNIQTKGFVIPYGDSPLDRYKVGECVYMDILNRAERYVHIMTPYLILDGEIETSLKYAAERGVDVKLILPGVPDKTIPYALARTHYSSLLESGVKIYEYVPGFVHAKVFVSDDREAVVGTINLDYRSLYHHFECATYMFDMDCVNDIENDFQTTLEQCREVTASSFRQEKKHLLLIGYIFKIVAPLM